jgi:hypothetical protein
VLIEEAGNFENRLPAAAAPWKIAYNDLHGRGRALRKGAAKRSYLDATTEPFRW